MTAGNFASTELNMDNNDITTVASVGITNGTTNVIQVVSSTTQALEFLAEGAGYATLKCGSLDADSLTSNGITIANTADVETLNLNGSLLDKNGFSGNTLYLRSTGDGVVWNAVNTPTLSQVMMQGNVAGNNLNMDKQNFYNALTMGLASYSSPKEIELQMNDTTPETLDIKSRSVGIYTPANINCNLVNGTNINFRPSYDYYVAKNGSDSNPGSVLSPFLTIQKAIDVCETFTDGVPRVVNVLTGSYVENLTLSKSRISIVGQGQSSRPDVGSSITGTITITISSGNSDLNNNNIYFSNLLINGQFEDNTSGTSVPHRIFFNQCQLYANNRVLYLHPSGDYRAFVSNCVISNDNTSATDPIVECNSTSTGMVSFTSNQITSKGTSQNVFKLSGSCRTDTYAQNILTSDSVGTNVAIAIFVHNSTATITLGQNAFVYSSAGAKRNADTAAGIFMNSTGGSLVIANNIFSLTGLPSGEHAVQNNSVGGVVIYGGNISTSSAAGTSAHDISGTNNSTKFAMTAVQ